MPSVIEIEESPQIDAVASPQEERQTQYQRAEAPAVPALPVVQQGRETQYWRAEAPAVPALPAAQWPSFFSIVATLLGVGPAFVTPDPFERSLEFPAYQQPVEAPTELLARRFPYEYIRTMCG
ncbi:MAG: hypothetical protein V3R80_01125 [Candidatus Tectomicrobia bacterium]